MTCWSKDLVYSEQFWAHEAHEPHEAHEAHEVPHWSEGGKAQPPLSGIGLLARVPGSAPGQLGAVFGVRCPVCGVRCPVSRSGGRGSEKHKMPLKRTTYSNTFGAFFQKTRTLENGPEKCIWTSYIHSICIVFWARKSQKNAMQIVLSCSNAFRGNRRVTRK